MSEAIVPGDLVMVVRWPHQHGKDQADPFFYVSSIFPRSHCSMCFKMFEEPSAGVEGKPKAGVPLSWLKKIPPLSELEGKRQKEDIPMYDITRPDTVKRLTRAWASREARKAIERLTKERS